MKHSEQIEKMKAKRNVLLFLILALTLFTYGLISFFSSNNMLDRKGIQTTGVITDVHHISNSFNQLSGESINNYHFFYTFEVNGKPVNGNHVIPTQKYHHYFDYKKVVGDSICVRYLLDDLKVNEVCVLNFDKY